MGQYDQTAIDSENADVFLSNEIPNAAARCASPSPARRVVPSPPSQPGPAPAISSPATPGVGGEDAEVESKEEQSGFSSRGPGGACRFSQRGGRRRDPEALGVGAHRCRG